jgi:enoyl-CoA hydratase/carnithine racemase
VIDRPSKANALTASMTHALADAVRRGSRVDVILVEGQGERGFSAGADIAEFLQGGEYPRR